MSVSVFWQPVVKKREYLKGQSSLVEALEVTFGELPVTLTREYVEILRGMSATVRSNLTAQMLEDPSGRDPFRELMDAISTYEEVTVDKEL